MEKEFEYMVYVNYLENEVSIMTKEQAISPLFSAYLKRNIRARCIEYAGSFTSVNGCIDIGYDKAKRLATKFDLRVNAFFDYKLENQELDLGRAILIINVICFASIAIWLLSFCVWVLSK